MPDDKISYLVKDHFPFEYKNLLEKNGDNHFSGFHCDRKNELRLLRVHYENSKSLEVEIKGLTDVIRQLECSSDDEIYLVNVRNRSYFFKLYFDKSMKASMGFIILKLRKKTEEEIAWGELVLGIKAKHPDM